MNSNFPEPGIDSDGCYDTQSKAAERAANALIDGDAIYRYVRQSVDPNFDQETNRKQFVSHAKNIILAAIKDDEWTQAAYAIFRDIYNKDLLEKRMSDKELEAFRCKVGGMMDDMMCGHRFPLD
jgi:hypothetical protein